MNRHPKLTLTASGLLLLALTLVLWPSARKSVPDTGSPEVARFVNRQPRPSSRPDSRPKRDFSTFVKLSTKTAFPKLTREQIDRYLEAQHRSSAALLAAFRLSEDEAFLHEAMEKFPHDPQVQLASLRLFGDPAKRLEILESLKHSDPDNGIVDALSACALFDLGKNDEALAALSQSVGKPLRDYTVLSWQNDEEAYVAAGFPPLEAKMAALFQGTKPLVIQIKNLAGGLKKQRESAGSTGDDAAVQSSRDIQLQLAAQLPQGGFMVGFAGRHGHRKRSSRGNGFTGSPRPDGGNRAAERVHVRELQADHRADGNLGCARVRLAVLLRPRKNLRRRGS